MVDTEKKAFIGLRKVYEKARSGKGPQFGLVTGAGVSVASGIPNFVGLAQTLVEESQTNKGHEESQTIPGHLVKPCLESLANGKISPEEILLITKHRLEKHREIDERTKDFLIILWEALYGNTKRKLETLGHDEPLWNNRNNWLYGPVLKCNRTLQALITLCLGTKSTRAGTRYELNPAFGAVLTTNYDNLFEAGLSRCARRKRAEPVGRHGTIKKIPDGRIPVYHIHGYLGVNWKGDIRIDEANKASTLIASSHDYYDSFYDPLGFASSTAITFFNRYHALFVGCSMNDQNLLRYLYHAWKTAKSQDEDRRPRQFAVLERTTSNLVRSEVLMCYGVNVIWVEDHDQIPELLRNLYVYESANQKKKSAAAGVDSSGENQFERLSDVWDSAARHVARIASGETTGQKPNYRSTARGKRSVKS